MSGSAAAAISVRPSLRISARRVIVETTGASSETSCASVSSAIA
jgi:hypothetical protein